jgi:hypothetical protein
MTIDGHGPGADGPAPDDVPGAPSPGPTPATGADQTADVVAPPSAPETPSAPPPRTGGRRPKLVLDSGFWVLLWVLGAVLLVALIIVAVSQVSPGPKKGWAPTPGATTAPVDHPGVRAAPRRTTSAAGRAVPESVERTSDVGDLVR